MALWASAVLLTVTQQHQGAIPTWPAAWQMNLSTIAMPWCGCATGLPANALLCWRLC
jgi:hypothetical protein